jgi:cytochrome c-type biogenesis protein CcmF
MGGAWAYEALSFGGFWAWDPVENSSLVPWLVVVAAGHLMIIERNRGHNLSMALLLAMGSFLLVLYSTFLTRSGILGDTSVHAFVDLGLSGQLLIYLLFFTLLALVIWVVRFKEIPRKSGDEPMLSREFWMFLGALTLLISSFQITFSTSLPVVNQLFGPEGLLPVMGENLAPPIDAIGHYNSFQVPFAILISLLMAVGQFLSYKNTSGKRLWERIRLSALLALLLTAVLAWVFEFYSNPIHLLLLFTSLWAVVGNLDYWTRLLKGKAAAGASMAHVGFGLILLGSLISNGKQDVISKNNTFIAKDFPQNENLVLELGDTTQMGGYNVVWTGERTEGKYKMYDVHYQHQVNGKSFVLSPTILMNERMGPSAEPATRHTLGQDLYTHVTYADLEPKTIDADGYLPSRDITMKQGDTLIVSGMFVILDSLSVNTAYLKGGQLDSIAVQAHLNIVQSTGERFEALPIFIVKGNQTLAKDAEVAEAGLYFHFAEIKPETNEFVFGIKELATNEKPFIVLKAVVFPMINVLWTGSILMVLGSFLALYERTRKRANPQ